MNARHRSLAKGIYCFRSRDLSALACDLERVPIQTVTQLSKAMFDMFAAEHGADLTNARFSAAYGAVGKAPREVLMVDRYWVFEEGQAILRSGAINIGARDPDTDAWYSTSRITKHVHCGASFVMQESDVVAPIIVDETSPSIRRELLCLPVIEPDLAGSRPRTVGPVEEATDDNAASRQFVCAIRVVSAGESHAYRAGREVCRNPPLALACSHLVQKAADCRRTRVSGVIPNKGEVVQHMFWSVANPVTRSALLRIQL